MLAPESAEMQKAAWVYLGEAKHQLALVGSVTAGSASMLLATSGAGVFGSSVTGIGVSEKGTGISGKGGFLAGHFEGVVEVTGGLVVAKVDVTSRIAALERELATLKTRVAVLESKAGGPAGGGVASARIDAELQLTGGAFNKLRISGSGFNGNEQVELVVQSKFTTGSSSSYSTK
jgi:hypothetical protein